MCDSGEGRHRLVGQVNQAVAGRHSHSKWKLSPKKGLNSSTLAGPQNCSQFTGYSEKIRRTHRTSQNTRRPDFSPSFFGLAPPNPLLQHDFPSSVRPPSPADNLFLFHGPTIILLISPPTLFYPLFIKLFVSREGNVEIHLRFS